MCCSSPRALCHPRVVCTPSLKLARSATHAPPACPRCEAALASPTIASSSTGYSGDASAPLVPAALLTLAHASAASQTRPPPDRCTRKRTFGPAATKRSGRSAASEELLEDELLLLDELLEDELLELLELWLLEELLELDSDELLELLELDWHGWHPVLPVPFVHCDTGHGVHFDCPPLYVYVWTPQGMHTRKVWADIRLNCVISVPA